MASPWEGNGNAVDSQDHLDPLCFVLMPFGRKMDAAGRMTNFDSVYTQLIAPAVEQAALEPIRADEEKIGGTIHKPMFERLMMCRYAVADITGANPNVYYELGIRHAIRPRSTVIVYLEGTVLPFDIALVRALPYRTDSAGEPINTEATVAAIAEQLRSARADPHDDSPIFQLLDDLPRWELDHSKSDTFRKSVDHSKKYKERLSAAVRKGAPAVQQIAAGLANLLDVETGIVVDLFLSLRDVKAYGAMIDLYERMPAVLKNAKLMRELLAFALIRVNRLDEADRVLRAAIDEFGASSETNGLLGRLYKDRWEAAKGQGRTIEARALLKRAVDAYVAGFQADWRESYPGVNAVTLMELMDKPDPAQPELLPVVRYSAAQRAKLKAGYWEYATLLELAILARDVADAEEKVAEVLATASKGWELETTERNVKLIREAREKRGEDVSWIRSLEQVLEGKRIEIGGQAPAGA